MAKTMLLLSAVLIVYMRIILGLDLEICTIGCECSSDTMECTQVIPQYIPNNITQVIIWDIPYFDRSSFSDFTWQFVQSLDIYKENYCPNIPNRSFENLNLLYHLGIHIQCAIVIEEEAFFGAVNVEELDLTNCVRLSMFYLIRAFNHTETLPKLRVLTIDSLNGVHRGPEIYNNFDKESISALKARPITEVYARYLHVGIVDLTSVLGLCSTLRLVDISNLYVDVINVFNVSNIECPSIRTVNAEGVRSSYHHTTINVVNVKINLTEMFNKSENLYRYLALQTVTSLNLNNYISANETHIRHSEIYFKGFNFQLQNLSLRHNKLAYLDFTFDTDCCRNLKYFDLADNGMQYFNPSIIQNCTKLKVLNLSNNSLFQMQDNHPEVFRQLFMYVSRLQAIDLSFNGLTFIPKDMFIANPEVTDVYLRGNKLVQLHAMSAQSLQYIDIRNNDVAFLDDESINFLQKISIATKSQKFFVNMKDNPLQCTCTSLHFLEWFIRFDNFVDKQDYTCEYHGKESHITVNVKNDLQFYCDRAARVRRTLTISISLSAIAIFFIAIMTLICRRMRLKRYRKKKIDENITLFRSNEHVYRFPVFLSYCNENDDFVQENIYIPLEQNLRNTIEKDSDLVGFGDQHFRPGYSIHAEILRCLEMSGVMIAVVSHEFCESSYCRNEIQQAYSMEMPIMLLFMEEVNTEYMTPLLKSIFNRNTRISIKTVNDRIKVVPDWDTICGSILELASDRKPKPTGAAAAT